MLTQSGRLLLGTNMHDWDEGRRRPLTSFPHVFERWPVTAWGLPFLKALKRPSWQSSPHSPHLPPPVNRDYIRNNHDVNYFIIIAGMYRDFSFFNLRLTTLYELAHLIFTKIPWGNYSYHQPCEIIITIINPMTLEPSSFECMLVSDTTQSALSVLFF